MSDRISRRALLAHIALTDAPTPRSIRFRDDDDVLMIVTDAAEHVQAWAEAFGGQANPPYEATDIDGKTPLRRCVARPMWRGQKLVILGETLLEAGLVETLDDTTREQLQAVADEPDAGSEVPA